jgi:hypothetical protein
MRCSRILIGLAAVVMLCACSSSSTTTSVTPSPTPTPTPANPCAVGGDLASPGVSPLVEVQPTVGPSYALVKTVRLTCSAILTVTRQGSATAVFGTSAKCTLTKGGSASGVLAAGTPAYAFFRLGEGTVVCDVDLNTPQQQTVSMCGMVDLDLTGQPSFLGSCNSNGTLQVAVHTGSVVVRYPHGHRRVMAGFAVTFSLITGQLSKPAAYTFSSADLATFAAQAVALRAE